MKKLLFLLFALVFFINNASAQLPDGSTAPNWTLTDINGNTHTLYDYLDAGKTVYIDFFATWCGPCWNYHNSGNMENLYDMYGPDGTDEVMVFGIEGDANTTLDDLYGTGSNTQGDWVTGTPYPIIEGESITGSYQIAYWPTIYAICPDRKITEIGQASTATLYAHAQNCPAQGAFITDVEVQHVSCFEGSDGSITLTTDGWPEPFTYQWSNGETSKSISGLTAGVYACTVTTANGQFTATTGDIEVTQPATALEMELTEITQPTCNSPFGHITVSSFGGEPPYSFEWSSGNSQESTSSDLPVGFYSVTVTDVRNCSTILTGLQIVEPELPISDAGANQTISCQNNIAYLDGSNSSSGPNILYDWYTFDGTITAGESEAIAEVAAPGTYYLSVLNTATGCLVDSEVQVIGDISTPEIDIAAPELLNCLQETVTLNLSLPSGNNFEIEWTTTDGHIVSGNNEANPVVDAAGTYNATVTNTENGCSSTSDVTVESNTTVPVAQGSVEGQINCLNTLVTLNSEGSSSGNEYTYSWTLNNEMIGNSASISVSNPGEYVLVVTNTISGCTANDVISVLENNTPPTVDAGEAAILNCNNTSITLQGSVEDGATFEWITADGHFVSDEGSLNPIVDTPGTYTLVATNTENGCVNESEVSITVDIAAPLATIATPDHLTCETTSITLDGTGSSEGTNFTYQWTTENGNITSGTDELQATVNAGGTYLLTVSNQQNGCVSTEETTVIFESTLTASIAQESEVSCNGGIDATLEVSYDGGTAPYSINWNTGAFGATLSNVGAGTYTPTITDNEGCSIVLSYEITEPSAMEASADITSQSAFGVNDGSIDLTVNGGIPPYAYLWTNGANTEDISELAPGTYEVIATDANGCTTSQSFTIGSYDCQIAVESTSTNITCAGSNEGSIIVTTMAGEEPFTYQWSNGATTASIEHLEAGDYQVTILDNASCPVYENFTITEPEALGVSMNVTQASCTGDCPMVDVSALGGTPPYSYVFPENFDCLTTGTYNISVTDANGCQFSQSFDILPIADTEAPNVFTMEGISLPLNEDGVTSNLTPEQVNNGSVDNCGIASMELDRSSFSCEDLGEQTVTLTVTDMSGNSASASTTIMVVDEIAPSLTCPEDREVTSCDHIVNYGLPLMSDNCSFDPSTLTLTEGMASGEVFEVGNTTVSYTMTDASDNEAGCSFNITVIDANTMEIALDGIVDEIDSNGNGAIDVTVTGGQAPFSYEWSLDGTVISNEEDLAEISAGEYTLVITDALGCQTDPVTYVVDNLVGTFDHELQIGLNLMPNPTTGFIYGKLAQPLNEDATIHVINILGQELISGFKLNRGATQFQLDLSELTKGTYFLNIQTDSGRLYRKILVE